MNNLLAAVSGNAETIGISIAFIILIVVMLWFVIGGKGKWWMKVPVIGFGLYISITMWFAMNGLLGWPTPSELPDKFRLHWVVIEEPDKMILIQGAFTFGLKTLLERVVRKKKTRHGSINMSSLMSSLCMIIQATTGREFTNCHTVVNYMNRAWVLEGS